MKQDLKNVIVTFGLIAAAIFSGSFLYKKKMESEYLIAAKQEELQNLINEQQAILDDLKRQEGTDTVASVQSIPTPAITPVKSSKSVQPSALSPKTPVAIQPSQPTVQPTPTIIIPTSTPTPVPTRSPVATQPTRRSRAS